MKDEAAAKAGALLRECSVAALGTLDGYAPRVTLAPFAVLQQPFCLIVLVSALSAHTKDMLADPRVALLVAEPERPGANVHALARLSMQGEARPVPPDDVHYVAARTAYEARFPAMSGLFDFGDFGLFAIRPASVRVVSGFAQAATITPESLASAFAPGT